MALELLHGANRIVPFAPVPRLIAVTVTKPAVVVAIESTYFVPEPEVTSQPQPLAAGAVAADWMVSLMEVRQADAAKTTSETFALMV